MGGQRDDIGRKTVVRACADTPSRFVAVHLRHLAIHQNDIVRSVIQCLQYREPVRYGVRGVAEMFQPSQNNQLIHGIVFRHEDPHL